MRISILLSGALGLAACASQQPDLVQQDFPIVETRNPHAPPPPKKQTIEQAAPLELRLVAKKGAEGKEFPAIDGSKIMLEDPPVQIPPTEVSQINVLGSQIEIVLKPQAEKKLADFSGANIGRNIAFIVDGEIISAPKIGSKIEGGSMVLDLGSAEKASQVAKRLGAKSAPDGGSATADAQAAAPP